MKKISSAIIGLTIEQDHRVLQAMYMELRSSIGKLIITFKEKAGWKIALELLRY